MNNSTREAYMRLAEYLPDTDKSFLDGMSEAAKELISFKADIPLICRTGISDSLNTMMAEIGETLINEAIDRVKINVEDALISFVDNNCYEIDENGNVVKKDA